MDPTTQLKDTVLGRWHRSGKEQLRTVQHYFDRRHLEASLASLLQAANGHEARGLKPGSALYLVLHRESQLRVAAYCDRWQVSPDRLHAELPALVQAGPARSNRHHREPPSSRRFSLSSLPSQPLC